MNAAPGAAVWLDLLVILAVGGTAVVTLTAVVERCVRGSAWQRALWRACLLGLALLLLAQITGSGGGLMAWLRLAPDSQPAAATTAAMDKRIEGSQRQATALLRGAGPLTQSAPPMIHRAAADFGVSEPEFPLTDGVWWPGLFWLLGAAVWAARALGGRLLLSLLRRRCRAIRGGDLFERVQLVAARLHVNRQLSVLLAARPLGPAAFGVWRPTVMLPERFAQQFSAVQQEVILAHELAHLVARDPAWHLLADLVVAALWWHPLAWWARSRARAAAEAAADEASLVVADGPGILADCLVALGGRLAARRPGWVPMAGNGLRSSLGRRVHRLLQLPVGKWRPPGRGRSLLVELLTPVALVSAVILSSTWVRSQTFTKGDVPMKTVEQSWKRSLAGIVLCATLGVGADAVRADDPPQPDARAAGDGQQAAPEPMPDKTKAKGKTPLNKPGEGASDKADSSRSEGSGAPGAGASAQSLKLKVFRVQHVDPAVLAQAGATLLAGPGSPGTGPAGGPFGGFGGAGPSRPSGPGMPGGLGIGGGALGGTVPGGLSFTGGGLAGQLGALGGGGLAGLAGGLGTGPDGSWFGSGGETRFAGDPRSRTLIVRGPEREVQIITDLVTVFDTAPKKKAPKVKNLHVFKLKHADPDNVIQTLSQLGIQARIAPARLGPEEGEQELFLIAMGPDDQIREVRQVIEALDVESKDPAGGLGGAP
jgi:beta-lactamase regulating signal transducer with metallopeptidase domain